MTKSSIHMWIKTPCGRAKYAELEARKGMLHRIRLIWFVFFAAIKDWNLASPNQNEGSES